ncbi:glucose-1-phosphate adenylyltransferase [Virgibacillus halodenitrificans]|uniref:Glucose-1-phosphate adenylyltransferase n=1 Tax=Virgibacillus halodenitrificans TaxID=1482 RepID=A0AAC9NKD1_VIRHA|nr:glucose-1-phosphate adenylyltransferase [Virgibacillus halodenitrificans]APC47574.1 glucose-1-phosphate adenylyltransferase [Virgibacillus halodenitrificans]CDQ32393.1 Glucose-1-phosphate adenylyltransferase [Virgibacillus halodenitrificans]
MSKKWLAMLLAGGQGTRLGQLTNALAKPAVPFGGKYRIIDFTLSNCTHSGIDTVGVLTQYQPHLLNDYVGNGKAWDLDRNIGGVSVLPPYQAKDGGHWFEGTADAVYQNIRFIDQHNPEYVLVISGDHIYKMDYTKLLDAHTQKHADATIAVIEVPWEEASRFGIMNVDQQGKITEFEEKPDVPESNLASMGVYLFNWKLLKRYLEEDAVNELSSHDFGKDIIPRMLGDKKHLYTYAFDGYWKDVGTIRSLWEANMDLLHKTDGFTLDDPDWRIYAGNANNPPQYISPWAKIERSLINEGTMIFGRVEGSVVSYNVSVGKGSLIRNSVIMPNVSIGNNVRIENAIIAPHSVIADCSVIGTENQSKEITLYGEQQLMLSKLENTLP